MLNIFLAITLGLLSITAHEFGHYAAMRRCGIKVKEISLLGFPVSFLPSFYYKIGETVWGVHLFPIGAYVEADSEDEIDSKSLWDQIYISGSGPIANLIYGLVLVAFAIAIAGIQTGQLEKAALGLVAFGGMAWLVWLGQRFMVLALPILTIPVLGLLGHVIFGTSPMEAVQAGSGGPVAVIGNLAGARSVADAFVLAASFSLGLGIINLAPLPPLDGGRIFGAILKNWLGERCQNLYDRITMPFLALTVAYFLGLDVIRILKWIW